MKGISVDDLTAPGPEASIVDVREGYAAVTVMRGITEWFRNGHPVTCRTGGK